MINISIVAVILLGVVSQANALQVIWQSNSGGTDLRHDGVTALDGSFQAEVGSFNNGFTPTMMNLDLWQANWRSFGTTTYNASNSEIRGVGNLANNNQFMAGEQVYLWIWNQKTGAAAEWLLVSNDSWTWPSVSPLAFSFNIVLSDVSGDDVVFGRANQNGFQIQTRRPFRGTWNYAAWLQDEFPSPADQADALISSETADPDRDGISNFIEFVMGTNPHAVNLDGYRSPLTISHENGNIVLEAFRDPLTTITVDVKTSILLNDNFLMGLPSSTVVEQLSDRIIYRLPAKNQEFFRAEYNE